MTNGDHEGRIFLSHFHTNNRLLIWFHIQKGLKEVLEYADMRHNMITPFQRDMTSLVFQRAAVRFVSFPRVGSGYMYVR